MDVEEAVVGPVAGGDEEDQEEERAVDAWSIEKICKSSLINAILDTPDLALTGANGAACTCVITEYHLAAPSQKCPFQAEVVLFNQAKIRSILEGHLQDYWWGNSSSKDDLDGDALDDIRSPSGTALEVFQALFANHLEFQSAAETETFLAKVASPDNKEILDQLLEWTLDAISEWGAVKGSVYRFNEDPNSLGESLRPFIKMSVNLQPAAHPALWPIVAVRQSLESKRENLVDRRLVEYTTTFGSRVALICTKADVSLLLQEAVTQLITQDVSSNVDPQDFLATERASWEYKQLSHFYEQMGIKKMDLSKRKRAAVGKAKAELRYEINAAGYSDEAIPISVQATGIPQLRAFLLRTPAEERLDILKRYCWGHLPSIISSMWSWSVQSTIHRRLELREVVAKPRKCAKAVTAMFCQEIESSLDKTVLAIIRLQLIMDIQEMHSATFRSWCRHRGSHSTKKYPDWNWNAGFLKPVAADLQTSWPHFDEACNDASKNCYTALTGLLDGIRQELSTMGDVMVISTEPFMKSLAPKKVQLQATLETFLAKLQGFISEIRLNVITDDTDASYLLKALDPLYQVCAETSGKRAYDRRVATLYSAVSKGVLFAGMEADIKTAMKIYLSQRMEKLVKKAQNVFDVVLSDFDSMFVVEERPDIDRNSLRTEIQGFVKKAEATMQGVMEEELARAISESSV
ncbi:MAG: hypothetical protein Q9181_002750 [Wetmoreana brouardii]